MATLARQTARETSAQKFLPNKAPNPSAIVAQNFSVPSVASNNPSTGYKVNSVGNNEISPEAPKNKIYGLTSQSQENINARKKSIAGQNQPEQLNFFQKSDNDENDASANLAGPLRESLLDPTKVRNNDANGNPITNQSDQPEKIEPNSRILNPESNQTQDQYNLPFNLPENFDAQRIQKIQSVLKSKMKIDLSFQETIQLVNSNFKIKSALPLFAISGVDLLVELTGYFSSFFFYMVGLSANFVPILGSLVGVGVSAVGIGMSIFFFCFGTIISILFFYWVRRYQNNCCDIMKINPIQKAAHNKWWLLWIVSYFIPFIGMFFQILKCVVEPMQKKRIINSIRKIIESTK